MDLTEAEDLKKRWQEYWVDLYKKDLHNPDNHDGVITDLEPDILECEVKWALESITMDAGRHGRSDRGMRREKKYSSTHQNTDTSFPKQETLTSHLYKPTHREETPQ